MPKAQCRKPGTSRLWSSSTASLHFVSLVRSVQTGFCGHSIHWLVDFESRGDLFVVALRLSHAWNASLNQVTNAVSICHWLEPISTGAHGGLCQEER
jgi:hypothetical protein